MVKDEISMGKRFSNDVHKLDSNTRNGKSQEETKVTTL